MSWETLQLGELLTLKRGYDLPSSQRKEGDIPIVSSSGITGRHNVAKVEGPGVITGRYGTLGEVYFVKEDFWPLNTALYVQDFKGNDARFTAYFLKSIITGANSDKAAVPGVNRNDLHARRVRVTRDVGEQKAIASILSTYDDLIDTNRRRIQLLEESARLLFREWFVYFRFPGHKKVKILKDGISKIPEGWIKDKVVNVINRIPPGELYDQETAEPTGSVPILDQGKSGVIGYHNNEPSVIASLDNPVIIFANHTCNQRIINFPFSAIQNILPFLPSKMNYRNIYWLHYATDNLVQFNGYKGHWPEFMAKAILLSTEGLCDEFGDIVSLIHKQIFNLSIQNQKLTQARDLLLPRLMSGVIEI